jgi:hypothetical protein
MQSIIATLRLNPWRWLLVVGVAAIAALLMGTWAAAAIMFIVVATAVSAAGRRLGS